mmetsp:Transcript_14534/g.22565  ORF Transcript_14534/g.22565 Transcript_14534/m.22565 type:complete len:271 (-) Transcript_14534:2834-3646(-)
MEALSAKMLETYTFRETFPNMKKVSKSVIEKLTNYHEMRDRMETFDREYPQYSHEAGVRSLLHSLGQKMLEDNEGLSNKQIAEKELKQAEFEQETIQAFIDMRRVQLDMINIEVDEDYDNTKYASLHDHQRRHELLKEQENLINKVLSPDEIYELDMYLAKESHVKEFLRQHRYEVINSLTDRDWLKIVAKNITKHGINVDAFIHEQGDPAIMEKALLQGHQPIDTLREFFKIEDEDFEWGDFGQYAKYIDTLYDSAEQSVQTKKGKENL